MKGRRSPLSKQCLLVAVFLSAPLVALGQQPADVAAAGTKPAGGVHWTDPDGKPLPFASDQELLEFLRTAEVKSEKILSTGVTYPTKVLLEKDGVRANAVFRDVDVDKTVQQFSSGHSELFFRDNYIFEPAAYELALLLGIDNVPPATLRKYKNKSGSIQVWVENSMTEMKRNKEGIKAPDEASWSKQTQMMNVFDALVYNTDRNRGNVLISADWKLWMIDHTRAFRRQPTLPASSALGQCERGLYQRIKTLDEAVVRERLKDYLKKAELEGLLARRKALLQLWDKRIAAEGEEKVLYSFTFVPATATASAH